MFCWDDILLGLFFYFFFETFLSLSLLRCGPDNNRTKEKEKELKLKKKQFEKQKKFLKKIYSNIFCLTFHLWASFHFVGHLLDISTHPFVTGKRRNKRTDRRTESSIYIAAMSQLKIQKLSNLIGREHLILNIENQIFPGHAVFARCSDTFYYHFRSKKSWVNDFRQKSKNLIFHHIFDIYWMIQIFFGKFGSVTLFPLLSFNFMPSFGKILWSVFEKISERTDTHIDKGQSIGPTSRVGGSKKWFW